MTEKEQMTLKVTVPQCRVKVCLAVLALVGLLPPALRDRMAEFLAPRFARWIVNGARFR